MAPVSEKALDKLITRKELVLHCHKRTRGVEETARRMKALIDELDSEKGKDTLGVDHEHIQQVWTDQQRRLYSGPEGFPLYLKNAEKGWSSAATGASWLHLLRVFHLHLNPFILAPVAVMHTSRPICWKD